MKSSTPETELNPLIQLRKVVLRGTLKFLSSDTITMKLTSKQTKALLFSIASILWLLSSVAQAQAQTIVQYGFGFTNGTVQANGGTVTNNANPGVDDAGVLTGNGGTYTNDVPPANLRAHTTGIGSLILSSGAIGTNPSYSGQQILHWADIVANGGLTIETWVKGGSGGFNAIMSVAAEYSLIQYNGFMAGDYSGFGPTALDDMTQWHHIAAVLSQASLVGGELNGTWSLYLDGVLQGTKTNDYWPADQAEGLAIGNLPAANNGQNYPFSGEVYEPRVTLGALTPSQFTIVVPVPVVVQYGFGFTNGTVQANGGTVTNNANPGVDDAGVLTGNGGTYTNDVPPANLRAHTTGIGSLILSSGAIGTNPSYSGQQILHWADIVANGGLTIETWVKGGSGGFNAIMSVAAEYSLIQYNGFMAGDYSGFGPTALDDMTQWHHIAAVLSQASLVGGELNGTWSLYLDGVLQGTKTNDYWPADQAEGLAIGNLPAANNGQNYPFSGEVYEPRVTLGALTPSQFTYLAPPTVISITTQPKSGYTVPGGTPTLTIAATVTGDSTNDLRYQWQENGMAVLGATNPTFTTPSLPGGTTNTFLCVVSLASKPSVFVNSTQVTWVTALQTGTVVRYAFAFTNDSVADNGGTVINTANPGVYDAGLLVGDGGTYTNDLPPASRLTNTTGIGSLTFPDGGAIGTNPSYLYPGWGIVSWTDILGNGGLTVETWAKGGSGGYDVIMSVGGLFSLSEYNDDFMAADYYGFGPSAGDDMTQWHHIAAVLSQPSLVGGELQGNWSLYLDGVLQSTKTNDSWPGDSGIGLSVGNDVAYLAGANYPFPGEVYEPRVTLGALTPNQFTVVPPTAFITITTQPQSTGYVLPGGSVTLTIAATVTGDSTNDLRYQWQENGMAVLGATNATFTTPSLPGGTTNSFTCLVTLASMPWVSVNSTQITEVSEVFQVGTIVQYAFVFTNGSVQANGGTVTNTANPGVYNAGVLAVDGGTYTNDMPPANKLTNTTGIGSLTFADGGAIATDPSHLGLRILDWTDIVANGGLTMEIWVKGGSSGYDVIMSVAGAWSLVEYTDAFMASDWYGFGPTALDDMTQWHHIAWVMSHATLVGGELNGSMSLYLDGVLRGTKTNDAWPEDLPVGLAIGNHPSAAQQYYPFPGEVYEPRITMGALTPSQFTILAPPVLSIVQIGNNVVIRWTNGGALFTANQVNGPWTSVSGAVSPYTNAVSGAQMLFFRVER